MLYFLTAWEHDDDDDDDDADMMQTGQFIMRSQYSSEHAEDSRRQSLAFVF